MFGDANGSCAGCDYEHFEFCLVCSNCFNYSSWQSKDEKPCQQCGGSGQFMVHEPGIVELVNGKQIEVHEAGLVDWPVCGAKL